MHADILAGDDRVELVGAADVVESSAERLAERIGSAQVGSTLEDLFRMDVDTV